MPWERGATGSRAPIAVQTLPLPMSSTVALNKTRSPPTGTIAGEPSFNSRPVLLRRSSSAKSGFRSLCGHEQRSF
jgi:hypothetical protein